MFELLQCDDIGMGLTESLAMTPAASVSGFYLGHPDSTYFNVGKIGDDQLKDLARAGAWTEAGPAAAAGAQSVIAVARAQREPLRQHQAPHPHALSASNSHRPWV